MLKLGSGLAVALALSACARHSNGDENYELLNNERVLCPPPGNMEVQPWGKNGLSRSCIVKSGPFVAAEDGYVHLRGQYKAGKQVGIWRWYDKQGNLVKEIDYSANSQ